MSDTREYIIRAEIRVEARSELNALENAATAIQCYDSANDRVTMSGIGLVRANISVRLAESEVRL